MVTNTNSNAGEHSPKSFSRSTAASCFSPSALGETSEPKWPDPEGGAFADYYREQEGTEPDDQAWLVWSALTRAWRGNAGDAPPVARLVRVEGGRLVLEPSQEQLTVRPPG